MNIVECTMRMKEQAAQHYHRLAELVPDADVQRTFHLLAEAEEEHIRRLRQILEGVEMGSTATVDEGLCRFIPAIAEDGMERELRRDPAGYRHVVREEEETIRFLERIEDRADNAEVRLICAMLAEREREHLAMVENIYNFVEAPRNYLEWGEFANLKTL